VFGDDAGSVADADGNGLLMSVAALLEVGVGAAVVRPF
jgi:hypothetical protein